MAGSDADGYCHKCGSKYNSLSIFCVKCGEKISRLAVGEVDSEPEHKTKTLSYFMSRKTEERGRYSKKSTKLKKGSTSFTPINKNEIDEHVTINVGVIGNNEKGEMVKFRGTKLPVKVPKNANVSEVIRISKRKIANHDQNFCELEPYVLLYPDEKVVNLIPGSTKPFTVSGYKNELLKPYGKIDLYLCLTTTMLQHDSIQNEKIIAIDDDLDDEIKKEIDKNLPIKISNSSSPFSDTELLQPIFPELDYKKPDNIDMEPPDKKSNKHFTICPVCHKRYTLEIIEEHVDTCLRNSENPFVATEDEPAVIADENIYQYEQKEVLSLEIATDYTKNIRSKILKCNLLVETESVLRLNARHNHEFTDFVSFFRKKWNQSRLNKITVSYVGECGVDTGGISREFYTEAISQVKEKFFTGDENHGFEPNFGLMSVADGTLLCAGHLFAASLCHHGPGPGFLSPWVFQYIVGGINAVELPQKLECDVYNKLYSAEKVEAVATLFLTDSCLSILEEIGYRGNPTKASMEDKKSVLQSIFLKSKVAPIIAGLNAITTGLSNYGLLDIMKKDLDLFQPVFCPSNQFQWTYDILTETLCPVYSIQGSSKKNDEISTYKSFLDFLETCFNDDSFILKPPELMQYLTGAKVIPPLGKPQSITISFKHGCKPSEAGMLCKCLPTVSTCAHTVLIPVHISSEKAMTEAFELSIRGGQGFQLC